MHHSTPRPALTPSTLRAEVVRIQREIAPNAAIIFTGRTRTRTVKFPTGWTERQYVLPLTVNGTAMEAVYVVGVGEVSRLTFRSAA